MTKTIIAAIALEDGDESVVLRATRLAAGHGARLVLLHVIESLPDGGIFEMVQADDITRLLVADATRSLERMAASAGNRPEIRVEIGKAGPVIERLLRDHAADLLIIGPGKPQNLRERLFGSTADRLVRCSPCPILVVKRQGDDSYRRIIAAVDFSPMSIEAARIAAETMPQARLDLVHVLEVPLAFEQAMLTAGTSQARIEQYRQARARTATEALKAARTEISAIGGTRVIRGDPATVLIRLARSARTDLVALGVQGRSAVPDMFAGSITRRLLAASSCDLLLARASR